MRRTLLQVEQSAPLGRLSASAACTCGAAASCRPCGRFTGPPGTSQPSLGNGEERWSRTTCSEATGLQPAGHFPVPYSLPMVGAVRVERTSPALQTGAKTPSATHPWCPGRDSNPHAFRHQLLGLTCLPTPPPGRRSGRAGKPLPHRSRTARPDRELHSLRCQGTETTKPLRAGAGRGFAVRVDQDLLAHPSGPVQARKPQAGKGGAGQDLVHEWQLSAPS